MDFDVASRQRRLFALAGSVLLHGLAFSLLAQGFEGQAPARPVAIQVELVAARPLPVAMAEATAPPVSPPPPAPKPQVTPRQRKQAPVAAPQALPAPPAAISERHEMPEENAMQAALAPANSGEGGGASGGEKATAGSPAAHASSAASSGEGTYSPAIFAADYLSNPRPAYPPLARRRGEEGQVLLRVLVSAAGRAAQLELQQSSGSALLDEAAQAAVRQWKFVPAQRGGVAVESRVLVPIVFRLE